MDAAGIRCAPLALKRIEPSISRTAGLELIIIPETRVA